MTLHQWNMAEDITVNNNHIVVECINNLGGNILDCTLYIAKGVLAHLGDTSVY